MTTAKAQKNGKSNTPKTETKPLLAKQTNELSKETGSQTIDERLQHCKELTAIGGFRERVIEARNDIRSFRFTTDEHSVELKITEKSPSRSAEFKTVNGFLIKSIMKKLDELLTSKLEELNAEILQYEV